MDVTTPHVHHTIHGTPTRKKENRNSRGKCKNIKKTGKNGYNNIHKKYARSKKWTTPKEGTRLNKNKSFKDEKF
jgi:hypothetical protein